MFVKTAAAVALAGTAVIAAVAPAFAQAGYYRPNGTYVDGARATARPQRVLPQIPATTTFGTDPAGQTQTPIVGVPMGTTIGAGYSRTIGSPYGR